MPHQFLEEEQEKSIPDPSWAEEINLGAQYVFETTPVHYPEGLTKPMDPFREALAYLGTAKGRKGLVKALSELSRNELIDRLVQYDSLLTSYEAKIRVMDSHDPDRRACESLQDDRRKYLIQRLRRAFTSNNRSRWHLILARINFLRI